MRIRHYGALGNKLKKKALETLRHKLSLAEHKAKLAGLGVAGIMKEIFGIDIGRCPACGGDNLQTKECRLPMSC